MCVIESQRERERGSDVKTEVNASQRVQPNGEQTKVVMIIVSSFCFVDQLEYKIQSPTLANVELVHRELTSSA